MDGRAATLALAGDTMLGRSVGESLQRDPGRELVAEDVAEACREADLFILNLECCISARGAPFPDPRKRFFFRAPPQAVETLARIGVDCVTLANNHALDFGDAALADTFEHLESAGIAWVGAGRDEGEARAGLVLEANGSRLAVVGMSDHPPDFAAGPERAGIAFADLRRSGVPAWLEQGIAAVRDSDAVLVTPHWGPNMTSEPPSYVRQAATAMIDAGATLVAGHSAHVFHGVADRVLYDLGDFLDDYRVDPALRNDLGLLFMATVERGAVSRLEAVPLALDYCYTRLADAAEVEWIARRLETACAALGTDVELEDGRLVIGA